MIRCENKKHLMTEGTDMTKLLTLLYLGIAVVAIGVAIYLRHYNVIFVIVAIVAGKWLLFWFSDKKALVHKSRQTV
jgi:uncharacterized integral membrane protein